MMCLLVECYSIIQQVGYFLLMLLVNAMWDYGCEQTCTAIRLSFTRCFTKQFNVAWPKGSSLHLEQNRRL